MKTFFRFFFLVLLLWSSMPAQLLLPPKEATALEITARTGNGYVSSRRLPTGGSGSVSNITFVGGLVAISNPSTTPAFTVAGTSGGIVYFTDGTHWASSGALAAGGVVIGGGAGVAPFTDSDLTFSVDTLTATKYIAGTSIISPFFASTAADPADAGVLRLGNTDLIEWEANPTGTDITLGVNPSNQFVFSNSILSPSLVTSLTSTSTTFALLNVTPTTINAFGNASTINIGNASTTTNLLGTLALNPSSGIAGASWSVQGTAPTPQANSISYHAPTSVPTAYGIIFPSAPTTGYVKRTGTATPQTESIVGTIPVADGGTGTASPALVAGSNVTITGTWPNQTVASSSASTGANPTGTIGLSGVNGSASTFLRSDGAPPLSQAIIPTWTGLHTFNAGLTSTAGTNSIAPFVDSVDGVTPLNNINQVVAAGTAYTMTATYGSITFGTTSPILTIANAGTYAIYVDVQLNLVGATYVTYDSASIKLRRTNNTAADLAGSTFGTFIPTISTITAVGPYLHVGPIKYTTTGTTDTITVQGALGSLPSAGSVTATAVTITAIRAY